MAVLKDVLSTLVIPRSRLTIMETCLLKLNFDERLNFDLHLRRNSFFLVVPSHDGIFWSSLLSSFRYVLLRIKFRWVGCFNGPRIGYVFIRY